MWFEASGSWGGPGSGTGCGGVTELIAPSEQSNPKKEMASQPQSHLKANVFFRSDLNSTFHFVLHREVASNILGDYSEKKGQIDFPQIPQNRFFLALGLPLVGSQGEQDADTYVVNVTSLSKKVLVCI